MRLGLFGFFETPGFTARAPLAAPVDGAAVGHLALQVAAMALLQSHLVLKMRALELLQSPLVLKMAARGTQKCCSLF